LASYFHERGNIVTTRHPAVRQEVNRPILTLWLWRLNSELERQSNLLTWSGGIVFLFPKLFLIIEDGVKHVSLNITFTCNFVNLSKPRQCLGLIVYWLCSV